MALAGGHRPATCLVFVDADLTRRSTPAFVTGIARPAADRPGGRSWSRRCTTGRCETGDAVLPAGGGRVTELVARPLLNLHWPELAGFVQPLGGEYAARRVAAGVGCPSRPATASSSALLVDTLAAGRPGRASPRWTSGVRQHRHQDDAGARPDGQRDHAGGVRRLEREGRILPGEHAAAPNTLMTQFHRDEAGFAPRSTTSRWSSGRRCGPGFGWGPVSGPRGARRPEPGDQSSIRTPSGSRG